MRNIEHRLQRFFIPLAMHLVEQQRQQDRRREAEDYAQHTEHKGVSDDIQRCRRIEKHFKIAQANPGASPDAQPDLVTSPPMGRYLKMK